MTKRKDWNVSDKTDKTCKCCGAEVIRRKTESLYDFKRRETCSRICGARYWRGIITNPNVITAEIAIRNLGEALRNWRSAA